MAPIPPCASGRNALQRLVARGFHPPPDPVPPVSWIVRFPDGGSAPSPRALAGHVRGGIAVLVPTFVERGPQAEQHAHLLHLLDQLAEVRQARPQLPISLWLAMQWRGENEAEATRRLEALGEWVAGAGIPFVGMALRGPGKLRTQNAAVAAARELGLAGWLWVDDDVRMYPGCLEQLVSRFLDKGCRGAVGASKDAVAAGFRRSRFLRAVKDLTLPPRPYPHACCVAVETCVLDGGISERRVTDDGFVLFELLDPTRDDPYADLEVLPTARCRFVVGGENMGRLRRSLYSHLTCMADYPWASAVCYFRTMLFYGLWPLAPWDGRRGFARGTLRWTVKAVYLVIFTAAATGLALRGLFRRPLGSVAWGSAEAVEVPPEPAQAGG